jgi:hypothetical protein
LPDRHRRRRYETGLRDGMRAAREARDAGFESVGVTGYRNLAIMAARVMDAQSAEIAIREGLQYADAIEQSHCRQMMATTSALLAWTDGRWDEADGTARQERRPGCRRGVLVHDVIARRNRSRRLTRHAGLDESLEATMNEAAFTLPALWGLPS